MAGSACADAAAWSGLSACPDAVWGGVGGSLTGTVFVFTLTWEADSIPLGGLRYLATASGMDRRHSIPPTRPQNLNTLYFRTLSLFYFLFLSKPQHHILSTYVLVLLRFFISSLFFHLSSPRVANGVLHSIYHPCVESLSLFYPTNLIISMYFSGWRGGIGAEGKGGLLLGHEDMLVGVSRIYFGREAATGSDLA